MPLRELAATDTVDVAMTPDYCSKALFAFMSTHRSTHLDIPRTPQVENICLPQFHCDRKSRLLLEQGPNGGTVGVADCLLWKLSVCSDTLTVDPEILQIVTLLSKAVAGGLDESYAAIATHYTEPSFNSNSRAKVQEGGRFFDEYSSEMLQARGTTSTNQDIDPTLLQTLWQHRSTVAKDAELPEDSPLMIPEAHAVNSARLRGQPVPECEGKHEIIVKKGLFNVFLWSHVMDCNDESGNKRQLRIDLVRLQGKMPGVEPIIFLENASRMELLKIPLLNVIKHMGMALCKREAMTMGLADAFSVGKTSQLSTICTEAHVPLAVFMFAQGEKLVNMHFGGMRIDVNDSSEMRCTTNISRAWSSHGANTTAWCQWQWRRTSVPTGTGTQPSSAPTIPRSFIRGCTTAACVSTTSSSKSSSCAKGRRRRTASTCASSRSAGCTTFSCRATRRGAM